MKPWDRTEADYLTLMRDGATHDFGEYDNTEVLIQMRRAGLVEFDPNQTSVYNSLVARLYLRLTASGRAKATE